MATLAGTSRNPVIQDRTRLAHPAHAPHGPEDDTRYFAPSLPLNHPRRLQDIVTYRTFFGHHHFYRQICRQSHLIPEKSFQHLSGCIEINRRSLAGHLSRCIEIYRLQRGSLTPSTNRVGGRNRAKKVSASNDLTLCLAKSCRQFFYRHGTIPNEPTIQKTESTDAIKWLDCLS
jgi:hypothetical protein